MTDTKWYDKVRQLTDGEKYAFPTNDYIDVAIIVVA